jgi:hypothetical protein
MPKGMTLQRADPPMNPRNLGRSNLHSGTDGRARWGGLINPLKSQNSRQTRPLIN